MSTNTAQIKITDALLEEYKKTCIKWDPVLSQLPVRAANDVLKYFTTVNGLRGKRRFGAVSGQSQFGPFNRSRKSQASVNIDYREIETFHGNVIETFAPVDYIDMPLGYDDPVITEAIKKAGSTLLVLAQLQKARGQHIAQAAITGVRDADGETTLDLCDGLLTIAQNEIEAGTISEKIGNLYKSNCAVTFDNACDIAKEILFSSNVFLRRENNVMLCSTDFADKYCESYQQTHKGLVYNDQYDQPYVEGSKRKLTIIGLPEFDGTDMAIVTQTSNLLCGIYNKGDESTVDIMREGHYDLSWALDMWLGFQFRTIDPRRLRIIDLSDPNAGSETPDEKNPADLDPNKTPKRDEQGNVQRDSEGHIIYEE